jgi:ABC-type glycerol-3-phosphate transport system substrate-binding protein
MDSETKLSRRDALKAGAVAAAGAGLTLAEPVSRVSAAPRVNSPVTLNAWTWGTPIEVQSALKTLQSVYPSDFNNVSLNVSVQSGDFQVADAFRLALSSHKNLPDIMQLNYTQVPEFAQAGVLRDLSDVINPIKNDLYAGALQIAQYDGKYVAFPYQIKSKLFFYRGDRFAQAGISMSDMATLDGFFNAGQKFHAKFPKSYIINFGPQPAQYWMGEILSAYPTARMADSSGNYQLTSNKAFTDMFAFFKRIHDSGIAWPVDDFTTDWPAGFKNGIIGGDLVASWMSLPQFLASYATTAQVGKWNVGPWPALAPMANQKYGAEAGGAVWVIPQGAKNMDVAVNFLTKWHIDPKGAIAIFQSRGTTPKVKSVTAEVLGLIAHAKKPASMSQNDWLLLPQNFYARTNGMPYLAVELASYDWLRVFPYDPQATKEFTILQQAMNSLLTGKVSVAQALAQAQSDMQSQIGNPYNS